MPEFILFLGNNLSILGHDAKLNHEWDEFPFLNDALLLAVMGYRSADAFAVAGLISIVALPFLENSSWASASIVLNSAWR